MTEDTVVTANDGDEDQIDGCDVELQDAEITPDEELPAALGGVEISGEGHDVDGCDVDFDDQDVTPDEELPAAAGGVA